MDEDAWSCHNGWLCFTKQAYVNDVATLHVSSALKKEPSTMNVAAYRLICTFLGGTGVLLGAFGAHALKQRLEPAMLNAFETGVRYQLVHALALGLACSWPAEADGRWLQWGCALLVCGTLLFSGSLYVLALTGIRAVGAITPIGGLAWLAAWACLFVALKRGA